MKRFLPLLLLAIPCLASAHDAEIDGIYYDFDTSAKTAAVTSCNYGYNCYSGAVTIPASVAFGGVTYSVTSIGETAFVGCVDLTSVTIPNSVTSIKRGAFDGSNITTITIPNSVISIDMDAFAECEHLTSITIGESVTSIGGYAFAQSGLTSVTCKAVSVPSTGSGTFDGIDLSAATLNVPQSALAAYKATSPWNKFGTILGFEEVTTSGTCGAEGDNLTWTFSDDGNLVIEGTGAMEDFEGPTQPWRDYLLSITSVTIGNSVTTIGGSAFEGCSNLTSIVIPNSVLSIGAQAFSGCTELSSISIPNSVTSVGEGAFQYCTGLTSVTCKASSVPSTATGAFNGINLNEATLNVPQGALTAYQSTSPWSEFGTIQGFTEILASGTCGAEGDNLTWTLYDDGNLVIEGTGAMMDYNYTPSSRAPWDRFRSSIKSVTLTELVTSIGNCAFYDCKNLTSAPLPESVTSIGNETFYRCRSLTSVTLPESVASIGYGAFYGCSALTSVAIPESVTSIENAVFYGCSALTSVAIPERVTNIGNSAFSGCSGLTSVTIPESVASIDNSAFYGCSGLTFIILPESVARIGNEVFYGCSGLTSVTIPNSVAYIGDCAFQKCSSLSSVTIPNSVITIGDGAFSGCTSLASVSIPNSVLYIHENAFSGCSALTSVAIPERVTSIGNSAFYGCSGLTSVTIPNSVTHIYGHAFAYCTGLTSITIPNSITTLYDYAFKGCTALAKIIAQRPTPPTISNGTFEQVDMSICQLIVPAESVNIYRGTDGWRYFVNIVAAEEETPGGSSTDETFETTDLTTLAEALYTDPIEGKTGSQMIIPVKMKNAAEASGFQFDLVLPQGVTVLTDEDGFYQIALSTERTTATKTNYFESDLQADGSIRVLCNSTKGYSFAGNDGEVALVTVKIAEDMEEGEYPIILKNIVITDASGDNKRKVDQVVSCLSLSSYTIGDANGDNEIDVADFSAIAAYILGHPSETFEIRAADVNNDQEVDVADLSAIAQLILHPETQQKVAARKVAARKEAENLDNMLYAETLMAEAGTDVVLAVNMRNDMEATGFQFDLELPEGVTVAQAILSTERTTARKTNFFETALQQDGTTRVLCNSTAGHAFNGLDGEVALITLHIDKSVESGLLPILMKNIVMTNADGSQRATQSASASDLWVNNTTGISDMAEKNSAPTYDLNGRKVTRNAKGVIITSNKKILKK